MAKRAATATSAEEYLSCWRGPLEQRLRTAVGKALAEQPKDPRTAVALELLHGISLEERAAALSAAQAEQEDGPHDFAGRPFRPAAATPHSPLPPPLPPPRPTRVFPAPRSRLPRPRLPTHGRALPVAGDAQVGCAASKNNETELRKLRDEIQSLKEQLGNASISSATAASRDDKADASPHCRRPRHRQRQRQRPPPPMPHCSVVHAHTQARCAASDSSPTILRSRPVASVSAPRRSCSRGPLLAVLLRLSLVAGAISGELCIDHPRAQVPAFGSTNWTTVSQRAARIIRRCHRNPSTDCEGVEAVLLYLWGQSPAESPFGDTVLEVRKIAEISGRSRIGLGSRDLCKISARSRLTSR